MTAYSYWAFITHIQNKINDYSFPVLLSPLYSYIFYSSQCPFLSWLSVLVCPLTRPPCVSLSAVQQTQLVENGVIPRLVAIMQQYPENDPLVNVCLLALCNLADVGKTKIESREALKSYIIKNTSWLDIVTLSNDTPVVKF